MESIKELNKKLLELLETIKINVDMPKAQAQALKNELANLHAKYQRFEEPE